MRTAYIRVLSAISWFVSVVTAMLWVSLGILIIIKPESFVNFFLFSIVVLSGIIYLCTEIALDP